MLSGAFKTLTPQRLTSAEVGLELGIYFAPLYCFVNPKLLHTVCKATVRASGTLALVKENIAPFRPVVIWQNALHFSLQISIWPTALPAKADLRVHLHHGFGQNCLEADLVHLAGT